jgi:fatty-acyl-CoA synthase
MAAYHFLITAWKLIMRISDEKLSLMLKEANSHGIDLFSGDVSISGSIAVAENLEDAMRRAANISPDKPAITFLSEASPGSPRSTLSYRELIDQISRAASHLKSLGVNPEEPVIFLAPATLDCLIYFWAGQWVGGIAPLNPLLANDVLAKLSTNLGARYIISCGEATSSMHWEKTQYLCEHCPSVEVVIADLSLETVEKHSKLKNNNSHIRLNSTSQRADIPTEKYRYEQPEKKSIAAFYHTGGTTGTPKVAKISQENIVTACLIGALCHGVDSDHVMLNGLPLFHAGGGILATTRAIVLGQTLVQLTASGFRAEGLKNTFWPIIQSLNITMITAVPTIYSDLMKTYRGETTKLRTLISGASKLSASLLADCQKYFGISVLEGYGMTETVGFCAGGRLDIPLKLGHAGPVIPFMEVRTVKLEEQEIIRDCDVGETGTVLVTGPTTFQGYTDVAATDKKFVTDKADGRKWINSEDLGYFDEDGYLLIVGREKELIIRSGHNIEPIVIEEALSEHPDIDAVAAVGLPDERAGELPIAFVTMNDSIILDEEKIRAWSRNKIKEAGASPVRIIQLNEMPLTAMNKIFKPELYRHAAEIAAQKIADDLCEESNPLAIKAVRTESGQIYIEFATDGFPSNITEKIIADSVQKKIEALDLTVRR